MIGIYPYYPGLLLIGITLLSCLFSLIATEDFLINKHSLNIGIALSPIWVLWADPCAVVFAQVLTASNILMTCIEQRDKRMIALFTLVNVFAWLFVYTRMGSVINECQVSVATNLKRDILIQIIYLFQLVMVGATQIGQNFKATKDALAQVKLLNTKVENFNEELKELLSDKDNFILLFSHETRNPLNILLGNLTLLLEEAETNSMKNKLIRCKFCADLLLQHLNNILDTGKLANKGTLEVTSTPVPVYEYLQSTVSFMEMLVKKKSSLKSEFMIPQRLPANLKFDMQRLTQVILNLLTNAVKFTDSGSISMVVRYLKKNSIEPSDYYPTTSHGYQLLNKVRDSSRVLTTVSEFYENPIGSEIQLREQFRREIWNLEERKSPAPDNAARHGRGFLKIEVADTGCGLKEEDLQKLFQKFSQTHTDGASRQIGSGLGLWITKSLCELMSGGVQVYSKLGVGTCFTVIIRADYLPVPTRTVAKPQVTANSPIKRHQRRVLIADDDPYNLEVHSHILRGLGFDVIITATNGQLLVDLFKSKPERYFEYIITDVAMPRLDGIQAALKVREFEKAKNRTYPVKIGFITGHSNLRDKRSCEKEPIFGSFYLPKPINTSLLESFVGPTNFTAGSGRDASSDAGRERGWSNEFGRTLPHEKPPILCVDDDEFNLDCLSEMLSTLGVKTVKARSGEEALSTFRKIVFEEEKPLKCVLMDCRMSGIDGWTASNRMKDMLKKGNKPNIPIIGLTGESKQHNIDKFRFSGMEDLIQKPISKERLLKLLDM